MQKAEITTAITPDTFKAHATRHLSNTGGIELMLHDSGDGVYYRYNYGQDLTKEEIYEAELWPDNASGGMSFTDHNGQTESLEDYMRVNNY
jgi:hypothetical protein